jgi:hypothetical protein
MPNVVRMNVRAAGERGLPFNYDEVIDFAERGLIYNSITSM